MITVSFVGNNRTEYVYPSGWNGIMATVDLKNLAFMFDEANRKYFNVYTIGEVGYYYENLTESRLAATRRCW
ncbi:MAG: hypothetical protein LBP79_03560 [Clostridiales bacterium]|jgi:hypothetical protein|nr:hypothetical protein [Clostridiales bacterium]